MTIKEIWTEIKNQHSGLLAPQPQGFKLALSSTSEWWKTAKPGCSCCVSQATSDYIFRYLFLLDMRQGCQGGAKAMQTAINNFRDTIHRYMLTPSQSCAAALKTNSPFVNTLYIMEFKISITYCHLSQWLTRKRRSLAWRAVVGVLVFSPVTTNCEILKGTSFLTSLIRKKQMVFWLEQMNQW